MWQRRHWMRRPRCRERALVFRLHQHCAARARGRRLVQRASAGRAICDGAQFELVRDAQDHARQRLALDDLIAGGDARRRDIPWRVACVDDLSQQIRHPHARAAGVAQALVQSAQLSLAGPLEIVELAAHGGAVRATGDRRRNRRLTLRNVLVAARVLATAATIAGQDCGQGGLTRGGGRGSVGCGRRAACCTNRYCLCRRCSCPHACLPAVAM
mmetsp:Transcript_12724/g.37162  ORF Transcript_12724/g.37162 Transcript_12724/m.37162 type:complete len:214 (+) Transcript_12724:2294-2935(+)